MGDQIEEKQPPRLPGNKAELLERIRRSRTVLEESLEKLSEEVMMTPGSQGWAIKDHLAHVAVWELGVAELLCHRPRFASMEIDEALYLSRDLDGINAQIFQQYAQRSLAEVMEKFHSSHQAMLAALDQMSDEDLFKPYAYYVPEGSQASQDAVINWIIGDTYSHYDEHNGYIAGIVQEAGSDSGLS